MFDNNSWHNFGHRFGQHRRRNFDENAILEFFDFPENCSLLDLGCGDGFFTKMFLKRCRNVTGVDLDDSYFEELQKAGIITYRSDICGFNQGKYDIIFMSNVYHDLAWKCDESFYKNLYEMSKKHLAILDFKMETEFGPPKSIRLPKERIIENFESHGFKCVKQKDLNPPFQLLFEKAS